MPSSTDPQPSLASIIDEMLVGRIGVTEAKLRVDQLIFDDVDACIGEVGSSLARLADLPSALQVADVTEVAAATAALISPEHEGVALEMGARALLRSHAAGSALAMLERARPLLANAIDLSLSAAEVWLAALRATGRHAELDDEIHGVLDLARTWENDTVLSMSMLSWARSYADRGRPAEGLVHALTAAEIRDRIESANPVTLEARNVFHRTVGLIARQAGDLEQAVSAFERARDAALADGSPVAAAYELSELALTWEELGDGQRSAHLFERAAAEADAAGNPRLAKFWRRQEEAPGEFGASDKLAMGRSTTLLLKFPERDAEAIVLLRRAVADAQASGDVGLQAAARNNLGSVLARNGKRFEAEICYQAAASLCRRNGDHLHEMQARSNLGSHYLIDARPDRALPELEAALTIGEAVRRSASSVELRQSVAASLAVVYDLAITACALPFAPGRMMIAAGHNPNGTAPRPEQVLDFGQRARAANFMTWLRMRGVVEADGDPSLIEDMLALRAADVAVELAAAEHGSLLVPLATQRESATRLAHGIAERGLSPDDDVPCSSRQLAAALREDELLLDILAVPDGVAVTCVGGVAGPVTSFSVWTKDARRRTLRRLRRATREAIAADLDDSPAHRAASTDQLAEVMAEIDAMLFTDVADLVSTHRPNATTLRLLITPENELFQLPFWRLATLVGEAVISVVPHPGALPLLARRRPRAPSADPTWLAVYDPSLSLASSRRDLDGEPRYVECPPSAAALLDRLPSAERIHVSSHGVFQHASPYRSGLLVRGQAADDLLSAPDPVGRSGLCLLTAAQLMGRLHLDCDLAVLAACDSGLPREHEASEFTGLPGALLVAGARNVVASLWPAGDVAAALLMTEFYAQLGRPSAADGSGRASGVGAALAYARARLARTDRATVVTRFGAAGIPAADPPFAGSVWTDCFQHYGID